MCGSMADIQSATAEIRQGKKEERKIEETTGQNIMSASAMQGGHNHHRQTQRKQFKTERTRNVGQCPT